MSAQSQRTSLSGQIDAIRRMIGHVQRHPGVLRPSEVSYEVRALESAVSALVWLDAHQDAVRAVKAADINAEVRRMADCQ